LAQETERGLKEMTANLEQLRHRLDALDRRLDDIDTMVSTIAERAMKRPLNISIRCPNCGRIVEIGIVGSEKMMK
jgi:predicted  nucleic acid-binding Zn-ribbon protein